MLVKTVTPSYTRVAIKGVFRNMPEPHSCRKMGGERSRGESYLAITVTGSKMVTL